MTAIPAGTRVDYHGISGRVLAHETARREWERGSGPAIHARPPLGVIPGPLPEDPDFIGIERDDYHEDVAGPRFQYARAADVTVIEEGA